MSPDITVAALCDRPELVAEIEHGVLTYATDDAETTYSAGVAPIGELVTAALTARTLSVAMVRDARDLSSVGAAPGLPVPFAVAPGVLRRHLTWVSRSTQGGDAGRN